MKNFTFAMKWHEILKPYSEDIRREVYFAVIEYAATGQIVEMQPLARMAFDFIRYEIDEKARRKEARLSKKKQTEGAADGDLEKVIDKFYDEGRAPEPVTVKNGGVRVTLSKERIRAFVRVCAENLIAAGNSPYKNNSRFMASLGTLVANRFEVLRQDLLSRRPTEQPTDELWDSIIGNAHRQFAA